MRTVHRYEVIPSESFVVPMPEGARVLHVALQDRAPHFPSMWVECDDEAPPVMRKFGLVGTGNEIPWNWTHVGTFQQHGYVWHVYEAPLVVSENDND